jgi:hypothetical protein
MKQRMNNKIVTGRADLVSQRGCSDGFWFQVRSITLAHERMQLRLLRAMRAQQLSFPLPALVLPRNAERRPL